MVTGGPRVLPGVRAPEVTEKQFQAQVIQVATMLGWKHHHHYNSRRSVPGWPDLCLIRPPRIIYAELKVGKNKTTEAQDEWLAMLAACPPNEVHVWRPEQMDLANNEVGRILARNNPGPYAVNAQAHRCGACGLTQTWAPVTTR